MLDDSGVVACGQPMRSGAAREGKELSEPEAAVAARAGIRGRAPRVPADESLDDCPAKRLAQVEGHVRDAAVVTRLTGGPDGLGRAARPLRVGPFGVGPEAERHADRARPGPQERNRTVDAAAHRHGHAVARRRGAEHRPEGARERVDGQRLPPDRRRLEQAQAAQVGIEPVGVGVDDPLAVDAQPDEGPAAITRRVAGNLEHGN